MSKLSSLRRIGTRLGRLLGIGLACGLTLSSAHAVPSYARQTGAECAACHVGGFGPQLTPYGMKFKIGGYTDSDGQDGKVPLSAMLVASTTKSAKNVAEGDRTPHFASNNNTAMQEASLFLAGRLSEHAGAFVQSTYSGVERRSSLDQLDIRYARSLKLGDYDSTVGVSINNNPTLTDPFNSLGQWRFPYTSSAFNPGLGNAPKIEGLGGSVLGANAYTFVNDHLYAELGLYNMLSKSGANMINAEDQGRFKGVGSYWRLAWFEDRKRDNFSLGLFGFSANVQPDRGLLGSSDRYRDLGIDASYQFLGNREHIATLTASYTKEWQNLDFSQASGESANGKNSLNQLRLTGSYHYRQTWGGTLSYFNSRGSQDTTLNGNSLNGRPNTAGYIVQADWTPWGKESSWLAPWANVRLGVQYTGYTRFMGGASYTDGDGNLRRARDNNTTMLFLWTSI